ncbi:transcriptional regulator, partial [Bacillus songklensis]
MTVNRLISTQEFNQMQSYKEYAKNRREQQTMKEKLVEVVKEAYGDSYDRKKQETKNAIDMMCWLAADRGYFFIEDKTLAKRYGVSDRTIRGIEETLREKNVIVTVYRRSSKQNGLGNQVHLFVDHPYFDYWVEFLQLDEFLPDFQPDFQPENPEKPCESKEEPKKNVSTYDLTLKTFIKHNKRKEDHFLDSDFVPSYVPERFILAVQPFFG